MTSSAPIAGWKPSTGPVLLACSHPSRKGPNPLIVAGHPGLGLANHVGSRQMDVIEIEGMMETLAAIVIAAIAVPVVFLGFIMVPVLIWSIMAFLSSRPAPGAVHSGDLAELRLAFGLAGCRGKQRFG